jgi:hypothetical protein
MGLYQNNSFSRVTLFVPIVPHSNGILYITANLIKYAATETRIQHLGKRFIPQWDRAA